VAQAIANALLETQAHVLVLNEYGESRNDCQSTNTNTPIRILHRRLEIAGYSIQVAETPYPTVVATRLPVSKKQPSTMETVFLDSYHVRAATGIPVQVRVNNSSNNNSNGDNNNSKSILVFGAHLEDSDSFNGQLRLDGMNVLLEHIEKEQFHKHYDAIMIVGDLNQQRERDYTSLEWQAICANKQRRDSPTDDGVAEALQQAGFQCSYDKIRRASSSSSPSSSSSANENSTSLNWNAEDPPPSTHWTGTIVDYNYGKDCSSSGTSMKVRGIHVSPCNLSDHRLIVTDWEFASGD
jgi:hypothetical protein